jgi:hypothetical protein
MKSRIARAALVAASIAFLAVPVSVRADDGGGSVLNTVFVWLGFSDGNNTAPNPTLAPPPQPADPGHCGPTGIIC